MIENVGKSRDCIIGEFVGLEGHDIVHFISKMTALLPETVSGSINWSVANLSGSQLILVTGVVGQLIIADIQHEHPLQLFNPNQCCVNLTTLKIDTRRVR